MTLLAQAAQAGTLDALVEAIRSLPWAAHALATGGLIAGLILWAMGRRVLRPIFAVIGALTGGGLGFFVLPAIGPATIAGVPAPFLGLFVGGVLGIVGAYVLYRFAVAISFAAVAGLAGILIAASALHLQPEAKGATEAALDSARQRLAEAEQEHTAAMATPEAQPPPRSTEQKILNDAGQRARAFLNALADEFQSRWGALPARSRLIVLLSAVGGTGLGLMLGLLMPTRSAAAVTACFGSAVWLPSAVWLTSVLALPGRGLLDLGALAWLITWIVVATLGFVVQMTGSAKKAKPAAKAQGESKPNPG